jgi:hypothetical protein
MVQFIGADQALANQRTLRTFVIGSILPLFDSAVGLIMALATVAFLVGVVRFIGTAGDDKSRSDGKQLMVWGTLALFCMVGVWGLVQIIKTTFFGKLP